MGIEVPTFVVLAAGNRELFLMDETPDGLFALYREPYGGQTCQIGARTNCSYGVVMYTCDGTTRWKLLVDKYFSRPDQLEIQDIRYANGTLYFNEACQETSKVAGGKCSSLVALDPVKEEVLWRTGPLVSNGVIQIADRYVIASYGFLGESSSVSLVRRSDGKVMQKLSLPSHPTIQVSLATSGVLTIPMGDGSSLEVKVEGLDGDTPSLKKGKLTPAPKKPPPPPPPPPRPTRPRLPIDF